MKEKILELLKLNEDNFVSGQKISTNLNVSRTAIWKSINQLKEEGYKIESVSRRGYRIISSPDVLTYQEIKSYLHTRFIGNNILHFDTIDSTNTKAKELAALDQEEGIVVIAEEQTRGRGRLGRNWISPKGKGVWMSIILRPDIDPKDASKITQIGAAAVYKSIKELGINTYIKWPNDIVLNGKKVCGILTEMSGELNRVNYVVIGIGINANISKEEFSEDIMETATSLKQEKENYIDRKLLVGKILNNFESLYLELIEENTIKQAIKICKEASILIGKEIRILSRNSEEKGRVLDITDEGELLVENENGTIKKIISGEISVRGIDGYV